MLKYNLLPVVLLLMSTMSSCTTITGYDNEAQTVMIQASKFASFSSAEERDREFCGTNVKLLRAGETNNGIYVIQGGNVTAPQSKDVYVFKCLRSNHIVLE